jgi:hypothetical protein
MTDVTPDASFVTRVTSLVAADRRPVLTEAEVVASIQGHPMLDADGLSPEDSGWTQTWNLYAILAELWDMKAGKVAGDFNFKADGGDYSKGDVMAHCLAMSAQYAAKLTGSTSTLHREAGAWERIIVNG